MTHFTKDGNLIETIRLFYYSILYAFICPRLWLVYYQLFRHCQFPAGRHRICHLGYFNQPLPLFYAPQAKGCDAVSQRLPFAPPSISYFTVLRSDHTLSAQWYAFKSVPSYCICLYLRSSDPFIFSLDYCHPVPPVSRSLPFSFCRNHWHHHRFVHSFSGCRNCQQRPRNLFNHYHINSGIPAVGKSSRYVPICRSRSERIVPCTQRLRLFLFILFWHNLHLFFF